MTEGWKPDGRPKSPQRTRKLANELRELRGDVSYGELRRLV
jgi:hypothetical protein